VNIKYQKCVYLKMLVVLITLKAVLLCQLESVPLSVDQAYVIMYEARYKCHT
jgi:hypothetical protein